MDGLITHQAVMLRLITHDSQARIHYVMILSRFVKVRTIIQTETIAQQTSIWGDT